MTAPSLSISFASQSLERQTVSVVSAGRHAAGVSLLVAARRYPATGTVEVAGLRPGRHYLLHGAAHRFARTDEAGIARIELRLTAAALLTVCSVV